MGAVHADISVSLDGYVTSARAWLTGAEAARAIGVAAPAGAGAVVTSRRQVHGPAAVLPARVPVFVPAEQPYRRIVNGATILTFVTGDIARAVALARATAGDKDVHVVGAASVLAALAARAVDELHLHVAPVLLGAGIRIFGAGHLVSPKETTVVPSEAATHLTFRFRR